MWQDLMKKAINATASSMVLANKYKQMKNRVQQTQAATSGTTVTMTSSVRATQKQYVTSPKMTMTSSPQTLAMKPVGTSTSQNQNQNQNWKGRGKKTTTTSSTSSSTLVPTTGKNGKSTGPITRSKAKDALIQLLEIIPENQLSDSQTKCEDNGMSDGEETEVDEDYIHVSHSNVEEK